METIVLISFTVKVIANMPYAFKSCTADALANLPWHTYQMSSSSFFFYVELPIEDFFKLKTTEICSRTLQLILLYNRQ